MQRLDLIFTYGISVVAEGVLTRTLILNLLFNAVNGERKPLYDFVLQLPRLP